MGTEQVAQEKSSLTKRRGEGAEQVAFVKENRRGNRKSSSLSHRSVEGYRKSRLCQRESKKGTGKVDIIKENLRGLQETSTLSKRIEEEYRKICLCQRDSKRGTGKVVVVKQNRS
jgi:hypothetical protein